MIPLSIRRSMVITIVIIFGIGFFCVGFLLARRGFSARETPSRFEKFLARNVRRLATPSDARQLKNPYSLTPDEVRAVSGHWMEHCALCHALDGSGDTDIGRNQYPRSSDMRGSEVQSLSDGELFYIISNGVRFTGMPGWGGEDSAEEIWQLVAFIRRLPKLEPEELKLMEQRAAQQHGEEARPSAQRPETEPHHYSHSH